MSIRHPLAAFGSLKFRKESGKTYSVKVAFKRAGEPHAFM